MKKTSKKRSSSPDEQDLPLISCVMPTYGRPAYVNEAVQMFLEQDYPNKELIILNDCAGQIYTCNLPTEMGVRVINHAERFPNLGEKRNACIELAKGEFIAVWDDDDLYMPWRLSYSYEKMLEHSTPFYRAKEFWAHWGKEEPLHDNQSVPSWLSHPNTLFTKALWEQVGGYPPVDVGEDAQFFAKIHQLLEQDFITYPIERDDRFFILRGQSDYPHMSMEGGAGKLDLEPGRFEIQPIAIGSPSLQARYQTLIQKRTQKKSTHPSKLDNDIEKPVISVCISLKNRSAINHGEKILRLFPNTVRALSIAAQNIDGVVELVVADFGSDDDPPSNWIHKLAGELRITLLHLDGNFSRGRGLNEAARSASSNRLLLTDADVLINRASLERAICLIDQGQAWIPIFHCFDEEGQLSHWLDYGHGIVGLERQVFIAAGGVPEFESWGGEDNIFSDRVQAQVSGVRERYEGLQHQWHPDHCRHEHYAKSIHEDYHNYISSPPNPADELPSDHGNYQIFSGNHPDWSGPLHFFSDGYLLRLGADSGTYTLKEHEFILLKWDNWPIEKLQWDYQTEAYHNTVTGFSLSKQTSFP